MMKIFAKLSGHITLEGKTCPEKKAPPKPKVIFLVTIFFLMVILGDNTQTTSFETNAVFYASFSTEQTASASVEP